MSKRILISDAAKEVCVENHVLRYWEEELHLTIKRNELGHRYYTQEDIDRFKEIKSMKERGLQLKAIKILLKNGGKIQKNSIHNMSNYYRLIQQTPEMDVETESMDLESRKKGISMGKEVQAKLMIQKNEKLEKQAIKQEVDQEKSVIQEEEQEKHIEFQETLQEKDVLQRGEDQEEGVLQGGEEQKKNMFQMGECEEESMIQEREHRGDTGLQDGSMAINIVDSRELHEGEGVRSREEKARRLQWLLQQLIRDTLMENNEHLCSEIRESVVKELDYQFRIHEEREDVRAEQTSRRNEEYYKKMDELLRIKREKKKRHFIF